MDKVRLVSYTKFILYLLFFGATKLTPTDGKQKTQHPDNQKIYAKMTKVFGHVGLRLNYWFDKNYILFYL